MSAKRVEYHEGTVADIKSAIAWYQERSRKAAVDFYRRTEPAAATIREAPERWPSGKNNTRRFLLWRFPFAIIYSSEEESTITVWAVAHGSRLPEYWTHRL